VCLLAAWGGYKGVIRDGVPVAESKRGPLGGELVRFDSLKKGDQFMLLFEKTEAEGARCLTDGFDNMDCDGDNLAVVYDDMVEINIPQPQRVRIMTAGEAAKLPDIVGKRVMCIVDGRNYSKDRLHLSFGDHGMSIIDPSIKIEVLD